MRRTRPERRGPPSRASSGPRGAPPRGTRIVPGFVTDDELREVLDWLGTIRPLWEHRFSTRRPPPPGETQRMLQRPVYWLGSWQFACLGYYHPPRGAVNRCVRAEPFPPVLARWVERIERFARAELPPAVIPDGWTLDTCLVNYYGDRIVDGRRDDRARVGAHRDFEPGPVGSVSIGDRAMFQFVDRTGSVVEQTWLEDRSLQLFAGPVHKDQLLHRVQRVDRKHGPLPLPLDGFVTRRVNFTFRWVPPSAVVDYAALPDELRSDVRDSVEALAAHAPFWAAAAAGSP
ncbi:MAG: alpha-ketoglutarate-dependent dioxygenase AlkB [Myxococcota bacterium]